MISPEAPYPLSGGGAFRTASLLHYLAAHYELDLVVFQHHAQEIERFLPPGLIRKTHTIPLAVHRNHLPARAWRNAKRVIARRPPLVDRFSGYDDSLRRAIGPYRYEVALLEHFWCASYVPLLKGVARRVILDLHNVESEWHFSSAAASSFSRSAIHQSFGHAAESLERQWLPLCDLLLVTSSQDAGRVDHLSPGTPVCVYPNAIPDRPAPPPAATPTLAFAANMEYEPNLTGIQWFLREVWPELKFHHPELRLQLIGKNEHALPEFVRHLPDVTCTGAVADPLPYLAAAQISIAPLLSGSGTRLKIIEAWAAARPVVSTHLGAEGLGAVDGDSILFADTPGEFRDAISRLLSDQFLRQKIALAGRQQFARNFTWERAWETLETCPHGCKL